MTSFVVVLAEGGRPVNTVIVTARDGLDAIRLADNPDAVGAYERSDWESHYIYDVFSEDDECS